MVWIKLLYDFIEKKTEFKNVFFRISKSASNWKSVEQNFFHFQICFTNLGDERMFANWIKNHFL